MLKIGVFDSGLGGLTVVNAMTKLIKGAKLFYIADTKNAPYGEKSPQEILHFSLDIAHYFREKHQIDVLIVACNTATAFAIEALRKKYPDLIIIGTEPGLKPALKLTKTDAIGVLATTATLKGEKYQKLSQKLCGSSGVKVYEQACVGLVEQIEKGEAHSLKTKQMLEEWLAPMKNNNVDTIVLGCTHYPLVASVIETIMNTSLCLIDTGNAISEHLLNECVKIGHTNKEKLEIFIYSTDRVDNKSIIMLIKDIKSIDVINIKGVIK